jgi:fumarylacetoacetate (FAA) hydrolase
MRIGTFETRDEPGVQRPGVIEGDRVTAVDAPSVIEFLRSKLSADSGATYATEDVVFRAPIPEPPAIRDFFVFEKHVATARALRGQEVPPFWYEEPVFYFTNPAAVVASGDVVAYPHRTNQLDYELEVAAVVGASEEIVGFTIMNDWSARDLQRGETSVGLGPAKGKDFATTLGPVIVTVDEFAGTQGSMVARVNGIERSRGDLSAMHYSWEQIRLRAVLNTRLRVGDILGSGTVGTGCILEHGTNDYLKVGDVVEMEVDGLGRIVNTIGRSTDAALGT